MACNGMFAAGSVQIDARMAPMAAGSLKRTAGCCWLCSHHVYVQTACNEATAGQPELAACKTLARETRNAHAAVRVAFSSLMVQRDQWDKYWGEKKLISKFAALRPARHKAAAPAETCQSLSKRCPWGRLGSVLYTCNRVRRVRRHFQCKIHLPRSFALHCSGP